MRKALVLFIRGYQYLISPLLGQHCRFYPTCSSYAMIAVERHGVFRGSWFALRRLARCHPWNPGGEDLVPGINAHDDTSDEVVCRRKQCRSCSE